MELLALVRRRADDTFLFRVQVTKHYFTHHVIVLLLKSNATLIVGTYSV